MNFYHTLLKSVGFPAVVGLLLFSSPITSPASDDLKPPPSVVRLTPPPPVIEDKDRHAELAGRRARVAQSLGTKAMLILFSAEPRVYTGDVEYEYRQENNLYYLTHLKQKGATLVMIPGNTQTPEVLFLPRRNSFVETWNGRMYSTEEAARASGIKEIWSANEFEPFMRALRARQPYRPKDENVLLSLAPGSQQAGAASGFESLFAAAEKNEAELYLLALRGADSQEYRQEQRFASEWGKPETGFRLKNASPIFAELRQRKSPMELQLLQHAIDITTEAHERSWVAGAVAKWEYEVDAQVAFTFKLRNADHWGYPSIVGCGPNATTLHYIESQGAVKPGDLILMDVGAEYEHYSADVTRTFPVNGKFSPAQAEIYQIVYDAQEAAAKAIRPGGNISDIHRAATEVIKAGLLRLGLITDKDSNQYWFWFMHDTSHWLGMNVHDVGNPGAKLEPGMVMTNEPGIYVPLNALDVKPFTWKQEDWDKFKLAVAPAFEKYKGIGVRIEDDMVVTPEGARWMTEALPRKLSEIEDFIARARREK
jgi:Xaa-Pro aminopeptidase